MLLWTAPVAGAMFMAAYILFPAFAPPLSPTMSPEEVARFFREHEAAIRGVIVLVNLFGCMLVPLFATIAVQMLRVVNSSPVFAYSFIVGGCRLSSGP